MRVNHWMSLLTLLFVAGSAAMARADDADVRKAVQAGLDRQNTALMAKDTDAIGKEWTAEYRSTDIFGRTNSREQALMGLKQLLAAGSNLKQTYTIEQLHVDGNEAIALTRQKGTGDF